MLGFGNSLVGAADDQPAPGQRSFTESLSNKTEVLSALPPVLELIIISKQYLTQYINHPFYVSVCTYYKQNGASANY